MSNIELRSVEASLPLVRSLSKTEEMEEERIDTPYGSIIVAKQGADIKQNKPVIITYHDIGLNSISNFQAFFNYIDMKLLLQSFCVLHVNAPGQEENAPPLPDNFTYPTMDQLAEQLEAVCKFYNVKHFIGLGVGAGANILCRFALQKPDVVDGLFLVNPTSGKSSWTEWLYQKMNVYYLGGIHSVVAGATGAAFPQSTQDYLMWHHFGSVDDDRNKDLVQLYRNYFSGKNLNARNLSMFIDSYIRRTDLGIERGPLGSNRRNFKCSVLVICGAFSPHVEDTVGMNARLNPTNSTWMKLSDCGMVLEEQPGKVAEAFRLFLQGLGYALTAYERRRSSLRKMSLSSQEGDRLAALNGESSRKGSVDSTTEVPLKPGVNGQTNGQEVHIVENPIQC